MCVSPMSGPRAARVSCTCGQQICETPLAHLRPRTGRTSTMSEGTGNVIDSLAIAATFTIQPLEQPLKFLLEQANLSLAINWAPYDQTFQELLSPSSLLGTNA